MLRRATHRENPISGAEEEHIGLSRRGKVFSKGRGESDREKKQTTNEDLWYFGMRDTGPVKKVYHGTRAWESPGGKEGGRCAFLSVQGANGLAKANKKLRRRKRREGRPARCWGDTKSFT